MLNKIPFLQPLTSFSFECHKRAFIKWLILVFFASAPVILTVLMSPVPDGELDLWEKVLAKFIDSITVSEQFVYSAAFLAPTIYLLWESFRENQASQNPNVDTNALDQFRNVMKVYKGYGWVLCLSIVILLSTAIGFSSIKTEHPGFRETFLYAILESSSTFIYLFSLYAFYLSIVQGYGPSGEFNDVTRKSAADTTKGLASRVNRGSH